GDAEGEFAPCPECGEELTDYYACPKCDATDAFGSTAEHQGLDWVVCGGESGPGARPMHPDWARSLRDQCAAAGVAFFFKQWGAWAPVYDREVEDPDWRRCDAVERATPRGQWLNLAGGQGFH